jgi:hypothetical protein
MFSMYKSFFGFLSTGELLSSESLSSLSSLSLLKPTLLRLFLSSLILEVSSVVFKIVYNSLKDSDFRSLTISHSFGIDSILDMWIPSVRSSRSSVI